MGSPTTRISHHTTEKIFVRGESLVDDLIGKLTFTEMMYFQLMGEKPTAAQTKILDAVLVTLMEHGITPSVIATRMVYDSCPEAVQAAVAAGLLGVGSTFIGTMEGCAANLRDILDAGKAGGAAAEAARAKEIAQRVRSAKKAIPGFGHPHHKPDDPRSPRLLAVAEAAGVKGEHIRALRTLSKEVDAAWGKHLTINATGAVAALLGEIGIPQEIMRGIAVVSRSAGLVGHIREEQQVSTARHIWDAASAAVPYAGK